MLPRWDSPSSCTCGVAVNTRPAHAGKVDRVPLLDFSVKFVKISHFFDLIPVQPRVFEHRVLVLLYEVSRVGYVRHASVYSSQPEYTVEEIYLQPITLW